MRISSSKPGNMARRCTIASSYVITAGVLPLILDRSAIWRIHLVAFRRACRALHSAGLRNLIRSRWLYAILWKWSRTCPLLRIKCCQCYHLYRDDSKSWKRKFLTRQMPFTEGALKAKSCKLKEAGRDLVALILI